MRNDGFKETALREALRNVTALLPASWAVDMPAAEGLAGPPGDALVVLVGPTDDRISFVVEVKRSGSTPTALLLSSLRELRRKAQLPVLFVSDHLGPKVRAALAEEGISYADGTGWVRLTSEDPLVLLTGQGAERSPRPARPSAVVRMNGVAANRTIRALATTTVPVGVRDLAEFAQVSPGSVSKLLATLAAEGIVDRDERGGVGSVRRRALIRRWTRDYSFVGANKFVGYYIAPRGLDRTLERLKASGATVAVTGSAAARRLLPEGTSSVVPLRLLALYVGVPNGVADDLGLIAGDPTSANVVLAAPQDPRILAPVEEDVPLAPLALVLADLLTLPSRSDAEADQLMDVLVRDDPAWED